MFNNALRHSGVAHIRGPIAESAANAQVQLREKIQSIRGLSNKREAVRELSKVRYKWLGAEPIAAFKTSRFVPAFLSCHNYPFLEPQRFALGLLDFPVSGVASGVLRLSDAGVG